MKKELNIKKKNFLRLVQKGPLAESKKLFWNYRTSRTLTFESDHVNCKNWILIQHILIICVICILQQAFKNLLPVGYRLFFIDYALCLSLKLQHFGGLFFLSLSVPYNRSLSIDDDLCRTPPQNPSHNITENLRFRSLKEGKKFARPVPFGFSR